MATLALAGAGALLGNAVGIGANVGWMIGSLAASLLFPAPDVVTEGPRLTDLSVTSSTYGAPIAKVYGTVRMNGNLIWSAGLEETTQEEEYGDKLGLAPTQTVITYIYHSTFAMALCEGELEDITRMWADGKLIYDKRGANDDVMKIGLRFRFYRGTEGQMPDSLIEARMGVGYTPAHRGLAYVVFDRLALEDFGNRIPAISFEVTTNVSADLLAETANFYTEAEGGIEDGVSTNSFVIDRNRNVLYTSESNVIKRIDLRTMKEDRQSRLEFDTIGNAIGSLRLLAVTNEGNIISGTQSTNSDVIVSIDPESLQIKGTWGESSSGLSFTPESFEQPAPATCCPLEVVGMGGVKNFVLFGSVFNSVGIIDTTGGVNIRYAWDTDSTASDGVSPPLSDFAQVLSCVQGIRGFGFSEAYILAGPTYSPASGGDVAIYKITIFSTAQYAIDTPEPIYTGIEMELINTYSPDDLIPGATTLTRANGLVFDQADGNLMLHATDDADTQNYLIKIDPRDASIVWRLEVPLIRYASNGQASARVQNGTYGLVVGTENYMVDTLEAKVIRNNTGWPQSAGTGAGSWDSQTNTYTAFGPANEISKWYFDRGSGGGVTLDTIVLDLVQKAGLEVSDVETTGLSSVEVPGYTIGRQITVRGAIQPLAALYFFDGVESDHKLKFTMRSGKTVAANIPQRDLAVMDSATGDYFKENRVQEVDLPSRFSLLYLDKDKDYNQATHSSRRTLRPVPTMQSRHEVSLEVPVSLSSETAKRAAEAALYTAWVERSNYSFKTPWKYLALDPGDIVSVDMDNGTSFRTRLAQTDVGADFSLDISGLSEQAAQYTSSANADSGNSGIEQEITSTSQTKLALISTPLIRDQDDTGRTASIVYFGMGGYGQAGWNAGVLYKSPDNTQYVQAGASANEMTWGAAANKLLPPAPGTEFSTDNVNTLTVFLTSRNKTLASITQTAMVNDGNVAVLVNSDGANAEIIQFRDATLNADGSYTLSGLLRGRRGTEVYIPYRQVGDLFVMLNTATIGAAYLSLSEIDQTRYYKGVTNGALFEAITPQALASQGKDLMPYAVVNHRITSGAWGSDMGLAWTRRTRIGGGLRDNATYVSISEDAEEYEVDIVNGAGGVLRAITGLTTPAYTYTAANQAADFPTGYADVTADTLSNASFEQALREGGQGVPGWFITTGIRGIGVVTGTVGTITGAQAGDNYLSMNELGTVGSAAMYQEIDISGYSGQIDAGLMAFRGGGYMATSGTATDTCRIDLVWVDADGEVISTTTGTDTSPTSGTWTALTTAGTAPALARKLRLTLVGTQVSSALGIEVYWDNITLEANETTKKYLNLKIYQISGQVGRGFVTNKQIEV